MEILKNDVISQLFYEAQAYHRIEDIEKLVETGVDLSVIPIQPLFVSLKSTSKEHLVQILPKLSPEQRKALLDLDLWKKDEFDPNPSRYWLEIYSMLKDEETRNEYIQSEEFLLTLKSQCQIYTFDEEEPEYPEHENFILTDDHLLLIEFTEDFTAIKEVQSLIAQLYYHLGVENAYSFLFKMVSDSYLILEEEVYQEKCNRLVDYGFIDYYHALEVTSCFANMDQLHHALRSTKGLTGEIDASMKNQSLHSSALQSYQESLTEIRSALGKLDDQKRKDFLHFNFVKLVNARLTIDDALKSGSVSTTLSGHKTRQALELGFEYAIHFFEITDLEVIQKLDFMMLYKTGATLLETHRRDIKSVLRKFDFEKAQDEWFLGSYWNSYLDASFNEVAQYKQDGSTPAVEIRTLDVYFSWKIWGETLKSFIPFIAQFKKTLEKITTEEKVQDYFYFNYKLPEIDFESLLLTSFFLSTLGQLKNESKPRMALTISELKSIYNKFFVKQGDSYLIKAITDPELSKEISKFKDSFGFNSIQSFDKYLFQIMVEQMNGYDVSGMDDEEFKHMGGPILLHMRSTSS